MNNIPDKILFIDFMNQLWRANTTFGPPTKHAQCIVINTATDNPKHPIDKPHCLCGAAWHEEDNFCYGDRYLIIYNFFRNLRPVIEQFSPDKAYFVLEGHPQFRYDLYSDYKANRIIKTGNAKQQTKDKVFKSKDDIIKLLKFLPITTAIAEKYEADDTIGSLCENMKDEDLTVLSGDSDYIQLLQRGYSKIQIYNPIKKEFMEAPMYPYICGKSIMGDKSDNIPALLKPKKAMATITSPEEFKKFMELEENRALFSINRKLVEFAFVPEEEIICQDGTRDFDSLRNEFFEMKFESIINEKSWAKFKSTFDCLKY